MPHDRLFPFCEYKVQVRCCNVITLITVLNRGVTTIYEAVLSPVLQFFHSCEGALSWIIFLSVLLCTYRAR